MQYIEFPVAEGQVYIFQTRNGKTAASAAIQIAVDMVKWGIMTSEKALIADFQLLHTSFGKTTPVDINTEQHGSDEPHIGKPFASPRLNPVGC